MFHNNINKPAITVFLPLTSAKTSFCQWQKLFLLGRFFSAEKNGFYRSLAKTCQPCDDPTPITPEVCTLAKSRFSIETRELQLSTRECDFPVCGKSLSRESSSSPLAGTNSNASEYALLQPNSPADIRVNRP